MDEQRHVIKRQTVEITLAKQENAWQMQQTLSGILQRQLPSLLDRCLSEFSSPDCLHRIECLELDLGKLDGNRLEAELLGKIETALRLALSEQIAPSKPEPVVDQPQTDPAAAHLELFELFIREGHLPWWAETGQRQLPEKSFAALIDSAPNALARLLPKLIREPRTLQRLISYFDDNHLAAMMSLLCFAPQTLVASLPQTLLMAQALIQQSSRVSAPHSRAALWQSLLQVTIAGNPVIFRHGEFLTAVMTRWAKLLDLSQPVLAGYLRQQLSSRTVTATDNEWLQALRLSASVEPVATLMVEERALTIDRPLEFGSESAVADPDASVRESFADRHRPIRNGYLRLKKNGGDAQHTQRTSGESLAADSATQQSGHEPEHSVMAKTPATESVEDSEDQASNETANDSVDHRRRLARSSLSNRYARFKETGGDHTTQTQQSSRERLAEHSTAEPADKLADLPQVKTVLTKNSSSLNEQASSDLPSIEGEGNSVDLGIAKPATEGDAWLEEVEQGKERLPKSTLGAVEDLRGFKNLAGLIPGEFVREGEGEDRFKSTLLPGEERLKSAIHGRLQSTTEDNAIDRYRLASATLSKRYALLKKIGSNDAKKPANPPFADDLITKQSSSKEVGSLLPNRPSAKNSSLLEEQAGVETTNASSAFSDIDTLYINNAGLCLLWPYFASFFERLELVQNGRFRDHAAKQCAVSLLHYLVAGDTEPPEYFLPFNKLLCAMAIDDVFELETPLTSAQIEACDELLAAVIDNAPVLNEMSVNGFRGSFLLREGSLSADEGCWLLRVERKTYDLVLERFPWSWQWFKLPWMEHPFRVEW